MTTKEKQSISAKLQGYCDIKGSQNAAARSLKGVSSAVISQMLNGQWDLISDEMWRNVASQIGYDGRNWVVVRTRGYNRMYDIMTDAQDNALVFAVIGDAGCGKSEAIKCYAAENKCVYHLCCSEFWNRKQFMVELLAQLGIESGGYTVSEMMGDIIQTLKRKENPLIVLDEADKLSDQVLYFFISIYNHLEDRCGIILCATNYLQNRIEKGVRSSRKGYKEIYSRICRKFLPIQAVNAEDVANVCRANGVDGDKAIEKIVDDCDNDLRRVKRLVHQSRLSSK